MPRYDSATARSSSKPECPSHGPNSSTRAGAAAGHAGKDATTRAPAEAATQMGANETPAVERYEVAVFEV